MTFNRNINNESILDGSSIRMFRSPNDIEDQSHTSSKLVKFEEKLNEQKRLVEIIAHEFRNPVDSVWKGLH